MRCSSSLQIHHIHRTVAAADHIAFRTGFENLKHGTDVESTLQLRLICNELPGSLAQPSKELLVEIKLYPQRTYGNETEYGSETETKCIFATATPFSSRNTAAWVDQYNWLISWIDAK